MNSSRYLHSRRGFTLMELMVAMAITVIIITVLVSITSIALDTWNRSRAELRASRQAKAIVETMARDFESLLTRSHNVNEWLSVESKTLEQSSNVSDVVFFTAATDRYNGDIGTGSDKGGDISTVAYRLKYRDPIVENGKFTTYVLNRLLVNPDDTFKDLLAKSELLPAFTASSYAGNLDKPENFVCENIYQFTLTFHIEVTHQVSGGAAQILTVPVSVGPSASGLVATSLKIKGNGVETSATSAAVTPDELKAGRLTAVAISITVLSDPGVEMLRRKQSLAQDAKFMAKNSYQYSKRVIVPGR